MKNKKLRSGTGHRFSTRLLVVCVLVTVYSSFFISHAAAQNLIPKPVSVEPGADTVTLVAYPTISVSHKQLVPLSGYLAEYLPAGNVALTLDAAMELPAEGYRLEVSRKRITITGRDYGGVWNGIQTLLQLFPPEVYSKPAERLAWTLPSVVIEDYPRMAYRGVMLDVARTFVPKEDVMRFIDNVSHHKINKLHWHLADDEGWRIEIKSYPRLVELGAFRGGDSPVMPVYGKWNEKYGGWYTQNDIREIVAYAAVRNVEIIPEIDLPGHSRAAAIAYPEILCNDKPDLEASAGYDTRDVWCAAREENYAMLDSIVRELAALFPSECIHLGGDEVLTGQWSRCPDCKKLMNERDITDPARLEDIFMERAIGIAASHGKTAGVWNEASASGEIPKSTAVWGWEGISAARKAAAAGYPTVVCAGEYFYFDMKQSPGALGHIWAGIVPLEKVYSFDLESKGFTPAETENVRGIEATLFTELMLENGPGYIDYQMFPRVCALAEVAWTPQSARSWNDFEQRMGNGFGFWSGLDTHFNRLVAMGIKYYDEEEDLIEMVFTPRAATFTSSLKESAKYPFSNLSDSKSAARTTKTCTEFDWFLWTFAEPVSTYRIDIRTGYGHLQRAGVPAGRVEVSYDGKDFETVAWIHDLKATVSLDPERPVRALRIVSESRGNGETFVIINPLKIW
jgi:hexosaminidase